MGTTNPARVSASQFPGTNQYTNLVPESWVKELLRHFDANFVFKQCVNFKYEKAIKGKNDTIHIRKVGTPSIKAYERNQAITAESMTSEKITFTIDQQKYWNLQIDDLDVADMDIDILNECVKRAGVALAETVDIYIESLMLAGADTDNAMGTPTVPLDLDPSNLYATLVEFGVLLAKTKTLPQGANPFIIAPTELVGLIRLTPEAKDKSTSLGDKVVRSGDSLGTFAGFDIIESRRIAADTNGVFTIVAGTSKEACTFAMKVAKLDRVDLGPGGYFAQSVRALYFYGGKVIYSEMLGILTCTIAYTTGT